MCLLFITLKKKLSWSLRVDLVRVDLMRVDLVASWSHESWSRGKLISESWSRGKLILCSWQVDLVSWSRAHGKLFSESSSHARDKLISESWSHARDKLISESWSHDKLISESWSCGKLISCSWQVDLVRVDLMTSWSCESWSGGKLISWELKGTQNCDLLIWPISQNACTCGTVCYNKLFSFLLDQLATLPTHWLLK